MALISLKCPNCSGDIELDDTRESGFCMYCGSKVMITRDVNNISIEMSVKDQRSSLKPLAVAYCKKREFAKAEEITRKLVSVNAADADIWTIDGQCHIMSGDVDGGLGSLEKGAILSGSGSLEDAFDVVADGCLTGPASEGDRNAMKVLIMAYSRISTPNSGRKALTWYLRYIGDEVSDGDQKLIEGIRVAEIPPSITSIGNKAFYGCTSLASVSIPDSVTSIGTGAFYGCTSLASVSIPDSVTSIGNSAFYGCTSLASVSIPDSVTSIDSSAFRDCTSLASVSIPPSVTFIGVAAFWDCAFDSIYVPRSVKTIGQDAFPKNCKILRKEPSTGSDGSDGERKGLRKLFGRKR